MGYYWNVVKREIESKEYLGIVKTYSCYGRDDLEPRTKALSYCEMRNKLSKIFKNHYYEVEFDFE